MITPRNEIETIVLFAQQSEKYGFEIVSIQAGFPDAIIKKNNTEYRVEFEYLSSNFWSHKHNPADCDLIICWKNDDDCSILPIVELCQPFWWETVLITDEAKAIRYWKKRALEAENKLSSLATNTVPDYLNDRKSRISELIKQGRNDNQIAQEIYGKPRLVGSFFYEVREIREQVENQE